MNTPTDTAPKANAGSDEDWLARKDASIGYGAVFYEIADMLGIGARPHSPSHVWKAEMRPKVAAILASTADEGAREATAADEVLSRIQDKVCECVMGDLSEEEATEEIGRLMNDHVASVLARLALAHEQAPGTARGEG